MDMIERVARANYERRQQIAWECGIPPKSWDEAGPSARAMERDCAIAALKALREPTSEMVDDGYTALSDGDGGPADAYDCWQAMIDTALAGEGKGE